MAGESGRRVRAGKARPGGQKLSYGVLSALVGLCGDCGALIINLLLSIANKRFCSLGVRGAIAESENGPCRSSWFFIFRAATLEIPESINVGLLALLQQENVRFYKSEKLAGKLPVPHCDIRHSAGASTRLLLGKGRAFISTPFLVVRGNVFRRQAIFLSEGRKIYAAITDEGEREREREHTHD